MSKIENGGPAFPTRDQRVHRDSTGGMTLRDWFAGQALPGIAFDCGLTKSEAAKRCYEFADAMLAERQAQAALYNELLRHLQEIVGADDDFRASLAPTTERDPLTIACEAAKETLARTGAR